MAEKPKRRTTNRFTAPGPANRNWLRQLLPGGHAAATRADAQELFKVEQEDVDDFAKMFDQLLEEQHERNQPDGELWPNLPSSDKPEELWPNLPSSDKPEV